MLIGQTKENIDIYIYIYIFIKVVQDLRIPIFEMNSERFDPAPPSSQPFQQEREREENVFF